MAKEEGRKLIVGTTSDIQDFFLKCGLKTGEADPWEAWLSYE
jgi:hypothetical protein